MHGFVIVIIVWAIRIALARSRGQSISFTVRPEALALTVRVLLLIMAVVTLLLHGPLAVIAATLAWPLMPLWLIPLTVRLGLPKTSYWATRIGLLGADRGMAVFNQLRALATRPHPIERAAIEAKLTPLFAGRSDRGIHGQAIAALAMYDALSHNQGGARALFHVVQEMHYYNAPWQVRVYSQAWLLADAAARGAYDEVLAVAERGPRTLFRIYMRAAALCILRHQGAPGPLFTQLTKLLVPGLGSLVALVNRVDLRRPRETIRVAEPDLGEVRRATLDALRLAPGQLTHTEVQQLATAWQTLVDEQHVVRWFEQRGAGREEYSGASAPASDCEAQLVDILAWLWQRALIRSTPDVVDAPLLCLAKDAIQSQLLGEAESIAATLPRGDSAPTGDYATAWRTWARLRTLERQFARLLPERRNEFIQAVGLDLHNHGAWLFNRERARMLGNDVFRWLLTRYPRDHTDYKTLKRNVRVSAHA